MSNMGHVIIESSDAGIDLSGTVSEGRQDYHFDLKVKPRITLIQAGIPDYGKNSTEGHDNANITDTNADADIDDLSDTDSEGDMNDVNKVKGIPLTHKWGVCSGWSVSHLMDDQSDGAAAEFIEALESVAKSLSDSASDLLDYLPASLDVAEDTGSPTRSRRESSEDCEGHANKGPK